MTTERWELCYLALGYQYKPTAISQSISGQVAASPLFADIKYLLCVIPIPWMGLKSPSTPSQLTPCSCLTGRFHYTFTFPGLKVKYWEGNALRRPAQWPLTGALTSLKGNPILSRQIKSRKPPFLISDLSHMSEGGFSINVRELPKERRGGGGWGSRGRKKRL